MIQFVLLVCLAIVVTLAFGRMAPKPLPKNYVLSSDSFAYWMRVARKDFERG